MKRKYSVLGHDTFGIWKCEPQIEEIMKKFLTLACHSNLDYRDLFPSSRLTSLKFKPEPQNRFKVLLTLSLFALSAVKRREALTVLPRQKGFHGNKHFTQGQVT